MCLGEEEQTVLKLRVARKDYFCDLCQEKIKRGTRHYAREIYSGEEYCGILEREHIQCPM